MLLLQVSKLYAAGGEDFAVMTAAGYRSETGWVTYAWYNGTLDGGSTQTEAGPGPIAFVKGIGSSGDTGTKYCSNCQIFSCPFPVLIRLLTFACCTGKVRLTTIIGLSGRTFGVIQML